MGRVACAVAGRAGSVVAAAVILSSCGGAREPVSSFDREVGIPWFESFDQDTDLTAMVSVAPDTRTFLVYIDCVGESGALEVTIGDLVGTEGECRDDDPGRAGYVAMTPEQRVGGTALQVEVDAPRDARWSLVIDQTPDLDPRS